MIPTNTYTEVKYCCPVCGPTTVNTDHIELPDGKEPPTVACDDCGLVFQNKDDHKVVVADLPDSNSNSLSGQIDGRDIAMHVDTTWSSEVFD